MKDTWQHDSCSPMGKGNSIKGVSTCYSSKGLNTMKHVWNLKHPDMVILTNEPSKIWHELKYHFRHSCKRESCWLKQMVTQHGLDRTLLEASFAPESPPEWRENPRTWLDSTNIRDVLAQYEKAYRDFEFIGPSPIDYDEKIEFNECVWNELCRFNLADYIKRGIRIIGIIFNLDPHDKDGSHWMCVIIDTKKARIYFFDSYGFRIHHRINTFCKDVIKQSAILQNTETFVRVSNKIEHQTHTDSECGMYCIYLIIQAIQGEDIEKLMSKRIPDGRMVRLRKKLFNMF